jgi:malonate-semialdehyde dehydrogenase (acetylating)/methylmalonate-semialdehyde dehydrogenase
MACRSHRAARARKFRYEAQVGNVGINVRVAAPRRFPSAAHARASTVTSTDRAATPSNFTQEKVVVERWHSAWSRKF